MSVRSKTGSGGRPWVALEPNKPPRVRDIYQYWGSPPPDLSPRCEYWVRQIENGWTPNRRIRAQGYAGTAVWFGVYLWECLNVLYPAFKDRDDY